MATYPFGYADRTQAQGQLSIGVCFEHGQISVSGTFDELRSILDAMAEQLEEARQWDERTHPLLRGRDDQ